MKDINWVDYYKDATREQIIADVINGRDYIKQLEQQLDGMKANEKMLYEEIDKWKIQYNRVFSQQAIKKLINSLVIQQDKLIESNKKLDIKFRRGKVTPEYLEGAIVALKQISSKQPVIEKQYTRLY